MWAARKASRARNRQGHLDLLITDSGAAGRKLLAAVITSLELRPTGVDEDEQLAALRLIRQLADDKRRWLPGFSPSAFIDAHWRPHVVDSSRGRLDRRAYELCAAYELRSLTKGRLTALGFTCAEISHELYLSPRTIETHRERIHHKLGLVKRWQLVRYALDHPLIVNSTAAYPSTSLPVALAR